MTETPPITTPAPASSSGGIISAITPDPVGTPDKGIAGYIRGCFQPYVNFNGRARRKEYGLFCLFYFVVVIALSVLGMIFGSIGGSSDSVGPGYWLFNLLTWLFALGCFVPACGVSVRRVHDMGLPFWVAIIAIVFNWVGFLVLLFVPSQDGANIYGPYPKPRA